jgi:uncharacterized protein YkwD/ribosomal protein L24E
MGSRTVARAWGTTTVRRGVAGLLALTACAAFAAPIGASTQAGRPAGALPLQQPVVGLAATPTGAGYWRVASDGGVFTSGDARFYGSTGRLHLHRPIVAMAPTRSGHGYWMVASDGGIFSFGDAKFYGSTGAIRLNQPIVGMAATRSGRGYWLVARDGGIFSFGDAKFHGSTGAIRLNQPIVGMAATGDGHGYWMVARDGGIFSFGTARFRGSLGRTHLTQPIVGMTPSASGRGYVLVAGDGGVFTFGDAKFYGSAAASCPDASTVGIAASRRAVGYWIGLSNARTYAFSATSKAPKCVATPADAVARDLFNRRNSERAARGRAPLSWDGALAGYAKSWSAQMSRSGFRHSDIRNLLNDGRLSWVGENIAWARGAGVASGTMHSMWMQSQGHRDNMMSPAYNVVGIGVYCAPDGTLWATQSFGRLSTLGPGYAAPAAPASPFVRRDSGGPAC